jgi:hypothetical protein
MQTREWSLYEDAIFCVYSRIALMREGSGAAARGDPDPSKNITMQRTHQTQPHLQGVTLIHKGAPGFRLAPAGRVSCLQGLGFRL